MVKQTLLISWTQLKICLFKAKFPLQATYTDRKSYFTGERIHMGVGVGWGGGQLSFRGCRGLTTTRAVILRDTHEAR